MFRKRLDSVRTLKKSVLREQGWLFWCKSGIIKKRKARDKDTEGKYANKYGYVAISRVV